MGSKFKPGCTGTVVDCDFVNVRTKVGPKKYEIVKGDQLRVGTEVELLAFENDRYLIMYEGKEGYIYKDYVDIVDTEE